MQANFIAGKPLGYFQAAAGGVDTSTLVSALMGGSIPDGCSELRITPAAQAVRWRDDGTAPTAAVGYPLAVGAELIYTARAFAQLRFIAQSAGAVLNIVAYGQGA